MEIDHHHHVISGRREQLRVPAIRPLVSPRTLRPAVEQKFQRILFVRIESRRLDHETLHILVVRAFERERLQRLHVDLRQQRVVHVRERFKCGMLLFPNWSFICEIVVFPNFVRCDSRHTSEKQCVLRPDEVVGVNLCRTRLFKLDDLRAIRPGRQRDEDRRGSVIFSREQQRRGSEPCETSDRSIKLLRQIASFT